MRFAVSTLSATVRDRAGCLCDHRDTALNPGWRFGLSPSLSCRRNLPRAPLVGSGSVISPSPYAANGELGPNRATKQAVHDFLDFTIIRYSHEVFAFRIWELRHNLTAYDGAHVALAEALSVPLITCDRKLAATRGHRATIEVM